MSQQWDPTSRRKRGEKKVTHLEKQLNARIDLLLEKWNTTRGGIYKAKKKAKRKMRKHVIKRTVALLDRARRVALLDGRDGSVVSLEDFRRALASERLLSPNTGPVVNEDMRYESSHNEDDDGDEDDGEMHETLRLAYSDAEPVYGANNRRKRKKPVSGILDAAQRRRHNALFEWHRKRVASHIQQARRMQRELRRLAHH